MKDVGMSTCKLSSCSSCLFAFLYRHPYFIHNLFHCFLYLFVLFLYDCKSTSIVIYSQDEVVTCISGGIYYAGSIYIIHFLDYAVGVFEYLYLLTLCMCTAIKLTFN